MTNDNMNPVKTKPDFFEQFFQLTKRHLLVFFKNKLRVFFTLMVPFIIFLIYALFLRDLELSTVSGILDDLATKQGNAEIKELASDEKFMHMMRTLVDSWMLSGILAITTVTVSLQCNIMIVNDREQGVNRDFASSPVSRNVLICSYFAFNFLVTVLICLIFLIVCLIVLGGLMEFFLTFVDFLQIVGVLLYASVVAVLFTTFICSFVKRDSTMASINTILCTVIGFLIGAFMPLAMLPTAIQYVCTFIPGTFSCSLLRFSFMSTPLSMLTDYVTNTAQLSQSGELISELMLNFGYNVSFFGIDLAPWAQAIGQLIIIIIFFVLNILSGKKVVKVLGSVGKKFKKKK